MDIGEVAARLGNAPHVAALSHGKLIDSFVWQGVPCALLGGVYGVNGYVYPPPRAQRRLRRADLVRPPFESRAKLDYISPDWQVIGFHTHHLGDVWAKDDAVRYSCVPDDARILAHISYRSAAPAFLTRTWTLDIVRVVVRDLAEKVWYLNYINPLGRRAVVAQDMLADAGGEGGK